MDTQQQSPRAAETEEKDRIVPDTSTLRSSSQCPSGLDYTKLTKPFYREDEQLKTVRVTDPMISPRVPMSSTLEEKTVLKLATSFGNSVQQAGLMELSARTRDPSYRIDIPQGNDTAQIFVYRVDSRSNDQLMKSQEDSTASRNPHQGPYQTAIEDFLKQGTSNEFYQMQAQEIKRQSEQMSNGQRQQLIKNQYEVIPVLMPAAQIAKSKNKGSSMKNPTESQRPPERNPLESIMKANLTSTNQLKVQIQDQGYQGRNHGIQNYYGDRSVELQYANVSLLEMKHKNKHNLNEREKMYKEKIKKTYNRAAKGRGSGAQDAVNLRVSGITDRADAGGAAHTTNQQWQNQGDYDSDLVFKSKMSSEQQYQDARADHFAKFAVTPRSVLSPQKYNGSRFCSYRGHLGKQESDPWPESDRHLRSDMAAFTQSRPQGISDSAANDLVPQSRTSDPIEGTDRTVLVEHAASTGQTQITAFGEIVQSGPNQIGPVSPVSADQVALHGEPITSTVWHNFDSFQALQPMATVKTDRIPVMQMATTTSPFKHGDGGTVPGIASFDKIAASGGYTLSNEGNQGQITANELLTGESIRIHRQLNSPWVTQTYQASTERPQISTADVENYSGIYSNSNYWQPGLHNSFDPKKAMALATSEIGKFREENNVGLALQLSQREDRRHLTTAANVSTSTGRAKWSHLTTKRTSKPSRFGTQRATHFFSSSDQTQQICRNVSRRRIQEGKKHIEGFLRLQQEALGFSRRNFSMQRKTYTTSYADYIPSYETRSIAQMSSSAREAYLMRQQAGHLGKLIENQKVAKGVELAQKKGLSVYHQKTFADMFQTEAHSPHFSNFAQARRRVNEQSDLGNWPLNSLFDARESQREPDDSIASKMGHLLQLKSQGQTPATAQGARARLNEGDLYHATRLALKSQEAPSNVQIGANNRKDLGKTSLPVSWVELRPGDESNILTANMTSQQSTKDPELPEKQHHRVFSEKIDSSNLAPTASSVSASRPQTRQKDTMDYASIFAMQGKRFSHEATASDYTIRQEFKNSMHRGQAFYNQENKQLRDLYMRKKSWKKEMVQLVNQQGKQLSGFSGAVSMTQNQNLPLLVMSNPQIQATKPARIVLLQSQRKSEVNAEQRATTPARSPDPSEWKAITTSEKEIEEAGPGSLQHLAQNPVSSRLLDMDDILNNEQFQRRNLNADLIQKKLQSIKKQRMQGLQRPKKPEQLLASKTAKETLNIGAPNYRFKPKLDNNPKALKEQLLKLVSPQQSPPTAAPQQPIIKSHGLSQNLQKNVTLITEESSVGDGTNQTLKFFKKRSRFAQGPGSTTHESVYSSQEKKNNWKPQHDGLFEADRYFMGVPGGAPPAQKTGDRENVLVEDHSIEDYEEAEYQPVSLKEVSSFNNELQNIKNLEDLYLRLDDITNKKKSLIFKENEEPKELTSQFVRWQAQIFYDALRGDKGRISAAEYKEQCQQFILNVFNMFPEDPLKNASVKCPVKELLPHLEQHTRQGRSVAQGRKLEEQETPCSHTFNDDAHLQQRYRVQLWYLNFCRFLHLTLLSQELRLEENLAEEDDEKVNSHYIEELKGSIQRIKQIPGTHSRVRKVSKKRLACGNILKNLVRDVQSFSEEERTLLKDVLRAKALLQSPMLKLIENQMEAEILDFDIQHFRESNLVPKQEVKIGDLEEYVPQHANIFETDAHIELFLNDTIQMVISHFKNQIVRIKKKRYVTFKYAGEKHDTLFNQVPLLNKEDQQEIRESKDSKLADGTNPDLSVLRADQQAILKSPTRVVEASDPNTAEKSNEPLSPGSPGKRKKLGKSNAKPLSAKDIVKQILNILNERETVKTLTAFENLNHTELPTNSAASQYFDFKRKLIKAQERKGAGSTITPADLTKQIPKDQKHLILNLYSIVKNHNQQKQQVVQVGLHPNMTVSTKYFELIRRLWQGADDKFDGNFIEYFKACHSQDINPVPLMFKALLSKNTLHLKDMIVTFEQAVAIKKILTENAKLEAKQSTEENPFLIKTLIIDNCNMTDKIFEQILLGINAQSHIRNIHYINGNILGPSSAAIITEICAREGPKNPLQELNFSSIQIETPESSKDMPLLIQITQQIEDVNMIRKLKFTNVSLSDTYRSPSGDEAGSKTGVVTSTVQNIIDILSQNPYLMYLNIAWCNIQLPELVQIASKFENCAKMEYLSIGGNQFQSHRDQELKDQFVQLLCDLIERPTSLLCYLDISDLLLDASQLEKVLQAIQSNKRLLSVNLGSYPDQQSTDMIRSMLAIKEYELKSCFTSDQRLEPEDKEQSLEELFINSGLVKVAKKERLLYKSTLTGPTAFAKVDARAQILLNRQSQNPELIFSSNDPLVNPFNAQQSKEWQAVSECFYSDKYRYTRVFWNQSDVSQNTNFTPINGQNKLKTILKNEFAKKDQLRLKDKNLSSKSPLKQNTKVGVGRSRQVEAPVIVAGGRVHQLLDARVYAALLWLHEITLEAEAQRNAGAREMIRQGPNLQVNANSELKIVQDECMKSLAAITENEIREALCQIAEEKLKEEEFNRMSDLQIEIASDFEQIHWQRMVDAKVIDEKHQVTVINPQPYHFVDDIQNFMKTNNRGLRSCISVPGQGISDEESCSHSSNSQLNDDDSDSILDQSKNYQHKHPPMYVFAGYLPPGLQDIFIYDRQNDMLYGKQVIIEPNTADHGLDANDWYRADKNLYDKNIIN